MKTPEPFTHYRHYDEQVQPFVDENTAPLYDKQALIDLLEEAAKECEATHQKRTKEGMKTGFNAIMECAEAIRKLKEKL